MKITIGAETYETRYFPFFLKEKRDYYSLYTMRYPSGRIDKVLVLDQNNYIEELKKYLEFLVKEYLLEDEDMLTQNAIELRKDIYDLFY